MNPNRSSIRRSSRRLSLLLGFVLTLFLVSACSERDVASLAPGRGDTDPVVFADGYGEDVYYQGFFETNYVGVTVDSVFAFGGFAFDGAKSLKAGIPPAGSALGLYTGGVLTSAGARDLADYNALTFYARAPFPMQLDVVGFGNDNTGTSRYEASRANVNVGTDWTFVVVPVPNPSRLISERGLFTFAESIDEAHPDGYDVWFDEIRFAKLDNIEIFRSTMGGGSQPGFVGATVSIGATQTIYRIDGGFVPVSYSPNYLDFRSSDPSVAVYRDGAVRVVGEGEARITAKLAQFDVLGTLSVTGYAPPAEAAPVPVHPAGDVVSLFSDSYVNLPVDTWRADWGGVTTQVADFEVAGNATKMYSALNWVGVDFQTLPANLSDMTTMHIDVYAPAGTNFKIELVSFPLGRPAPFVIDDEFDPPFAAGEWLSLEIPLASFALPDGDWDWAEIGQMVLSSSDAKLVLVDNIYWHK